jgi:signal transduction histidine kinase
VTSTWRTGPGAPGPAGGAGATVALRYGLGELTVQVDNDGDVPSARSAGQRLGLIGMRERVAALGGRLHAGPQEDGGFRVRAELPVRAAS